MAASRHPGSTRQRGPLWCEVVCWAAQQRESVARSKRGPLVALARYGYDSATASLASLGRWPDGVRRNHQLNALDLAGRFS